MLTGDRLYVVPPFAFRGISMQAEQSRLVRWLRKWRITLIATSIFLVVAATMWVLAKREHSKSIVEMFGGEQGIETVAHPERVEAFRLGPLPENISPREATLNDYPVVSGPIALPEEFIQEVSASLRSTRSYYWGNERKSCIPIFGARISFFRGTD